MAKIQEQVVVIKFSKLVKDGDTDEKIIDSEVISSLEAVAQELVSNGIIVEVEMV